jgi:hypothetical protein
VGLQDLLVQQELWVLVVLLVLQVYLKHQELQVLVEVQVQQVL